MSTDRLVRKMTPGGGSSDRDLAAPSEASIEGRRSDGRSALAIVGFGCFLALQTYYGLSFALPLAESYVTFSAIVLRIVSICGAVIVLALCRLFPQIPVMRNDGAMMALAMTSCVPFAYEIVVGVFGADLFPLSCVIWFIFGAGYASAAQLWALAMSQHSFVRKPKTFACGALLSVCLFVVTSVFQPPVLSLAATLVVVVAGNVIGFVLVRDGDISSLSLNDEREMPKSSLVLPARFWGVCSNAAYGLMLIVGGMQGFVGVLIIGACGIVGALLSVVARRLAPSHFMPARQMQQWSVPVFVTTLLLVPFLDPIGLVVCAGVAVAFHSCSTLLGWYEMTNDSLEFHLHPVLRFTQDSMPKWIGILAGSVVGLIVFGYGVMEGESLEILMIVFVFLLLVSFAGLSVRQEQLLDAMDREIIGGSISSEVKGRGAFVEQCRAVAERGALSPRETEVLMLLAKGRNARHIQDKLCISLSTVRTHIYHIYQKLGVSSQQELIDLIERNR